MSDPKEEVSPTQRSGRSSVTPPGIAWRHAAIRVVGVALALVVGGLVGLSVFLLMGGAL
jgi:hypothetical protein